MGELGPGAAWWAVVISAIPSVAAGLFMFVKWWGERKDTSEGRRMTREQSEAAEIARDRERLSGMTNAWIERLQSENDRLHKRVHDMSRSLDDAEKEVDDWRSFAWRVRGMGREARQIADAERRAAGRADTTIAWPPEPTEPPPRRGA